MDDQTAPPKKHLFTKMNYLLDLDYLHELEAKAPSGAVEEFMSNLCSTFLQAAPARIQELDAALAKGNGKAIAQASHQLKKLCSGIGTKYLVELCQQIEQSVASKNLSLSRMLGEQLKDSFLVTRDQVLAYVAQLSKKS